MLEGLYTAAAGMAAQQQRMDALSNDIANVNTAGYRHERVGFEDLIYQPDGPSGVDTGAGAAAVDVGRGMQQGPMQRTDQPLDFAIGGPGYFQVRLPTGQLALTRAGNFQVNANGQLVTATGAQLVPPITLPAGTDPKQLLVHPDGTVDAGGRRLGQITLVTVPSQTGLLANGDNMFLPTAASGAPQAVAKPTIEQGALEGSDVDLTDTMVDLMDSQRSYAMASKAIQMQDQMMQIANGVKQ